MIDIKNNTIKSAIIFVKEDSSLVFPLNVIECSVDDNSTLVTFININTGKIVENILIDELTIKGSGVTIDNVIDKFAELK